MKEHQHSKKKHHSKEHERLSSELAQLVETAGALLLSRHGKDVSALKKLHLGMIHLSQDPDNFSNSEVCGAEDKECDALMEEIKKKTKELRAVSNEGPSAKQTEASMMKGFLKALVFFAGGGAIAAVISNKKWSRERYELELKLATEAQEAALTLCQHIGVKDPVAALQRILNGEGEPNFSYIREYTPSLGMVVTAGVAGLAGNHIDNPAVMYGTSLLALGTAVNASITWLRSHKKPAANALEKGISDYVTASISHHMNRHSPTWMFGKSVPAPSTEDVVSKNQ